MDPIASVFVLLIALGSAVGMDSCAGLEEGAITSWACRGYTYCHNNVPTFVDCWRNLMVFDETKGICVDPGTLPTTNPCCCQRDCSDLADGNYADLMTDCKMYYTCYNHLFYGHQHCPAGLVFDEAGGTCNWPFLVPPPCGTA